MMSCLAPLQWRITPLEDGILLKSDGMPTYNLANVVDDHLMKINPVVRGSEYLSSTPRYNLIYESFGWEIPRYIHLSPVMKEPGKKLSKRDGDASFEDFYSKGYLKDAIELCSPAWLEPR
jgi:glutamyl-tRNA synthetase